MDSMIMDIKEIRHEGADWSASEWGPLVVTRQIPEKAGNSVTNSATVACFKVLSQRYQVNYNFGFETSDWFLPDPCIDSDIQSLAYLLLTSKLNCMVWNTAVALSSPHGTRSIHSTVRKC